MTEAIENEEYYEEEDTTTEGVDDVMPPDFDEVEELAIPKGKHLFRITEVEMKMTKGGRKPDGSIKHKRQQYTLKGVFEGNEDPEGIINGMEARIQWWKPVAQDPKRSADYMWLGLKRLAASFEVDPEAAVQDMSIFEDTIGEVVVKYEKDQNGDVSDFPTLSAPKLKKD